MKCISIFNPRNYPAIWTSYRSHQLRKNIILVSYVTRNSVYKKVSISCATNTGGSIGSRLFGGFSLPSLTCIFKPVPDSTFCPRWAFLQSLTAIVILTLTSASKHVLSLSHPHPLLHTAVSKALASM